MINRTTLSLLSILLLVGSSSPALARPGGGNSGGPGKNLIHKLGLEAEVLGEIKSIRREMRDDKLELKYSLEKAKNRLKDLLDEDSPRESEVMDAAERVSQLQLKLKKARLRTMLRINGLLTSEQRMHLRELQREHKKNKFKGKKKRRSQLH